VIIALATDHGISADAAVDPVVATATRKDVIVVVAADVIVEVVAGAAYGAT
jgi:hypothetical protein